MRQQVVGFDVAHGFVDIFTYFFVITLQFLEEVFDVNPFRCFAGGAVVFQNMESAFPAVFFHQIFSQLNQRADNVQFSAEDALIGHHRADFPPVKHID